jgi:hypothetical protein
MEHWDAPLKERIWQPALDGAWTSAKVNAMKETKDTRMSFIGLWGV